VNKQCKPVASNDPHKTGRNKMEKREIEKENRKCSECYRYSIVRFFFLFKIDTIQL